METGRKFHEKKAGGGTPRRHGGSVHVGDGSPVPKPTGYGFAEKDANIQHFTAGTGNPSPTK